MVSVRSPGVLKGSGVLVTADVSLGPKSLAVTTANVDPQLRRDGHNYSCSLVRIRYLCIELTSFFTAAAL